MKKVGQPPLDLFEKAEQWYDSHTKTREFAKAIEAAGALTGTISAADRLKVLKDLKASVSKYESSTLKLQNALSLKLKAHFHKRGINVNSIIRLAYPVYGEQGQEGGAPRIVQATIRVKAFNYQPKDAHNPEARFRVIGNVATGDNEFSEENRYFPLDKYCSFEYVA